MANKDTFGSWTYWRWDAARICWNDVLILWEKVRYVSQSWDIISFSLTILPTCSLAFGMGGAFFNRLVVVYKVFQRSFFLKFFSRHIFVQTTILLIPYCQDFYYVKAATSCILDKLVFNYIVADNCLSNKLNWIELRKGNIWFTTVKICLYKPCCRSYSCLIRQKYYHNLNFYVFYCSA